RADLCEIRLNSAVKTIKWGGDGVEVLAEQHDRRSQSTPGPERFRAPKIIVTLPLGVLQARAGGAHVEFEPEMQTKKSALGQLEMGQVIRVSLCFRERFWDAIRAGGRTLADLCFLFSDDEWFPTWWTLHPQRIPVLTAWAAGPHGAKLTGQPPEQLAARAIERLATLLPVSSADFLQQQLVSYYTHDWQSDPYARGAYSYVLVGGMKAQGELAAPVGGKLFFAGEATETNGHHSTVHGAISSGVRAAREALG
ncbi:MAG TPA: NAD(P)/FAD-dependent oxidoreductase, partial [Terriglobales bacterium]|nr:NAD(P)/FAD-dependent oxidoreductase [Terriglobales bacterium]